MAVWVAAIRSCAVEITRCVKNQCAVRPTAIGKTGEIVKDGLGPLSLRPRRECEDSSLIGSAAVADPIKISHAVEDQRAVGNATVRASDKVVNHGLGPTSVRIGRQAVYDATAFITGSEAAVSFAIQVPGLVENESAGWESSVGGAGKVVEQTLYPFAAGERELENDAVSVGASTLSDAVKISGGIGDEAGLRTFAIRHHSEIVEHRFALAECERVNTDN